MSFVEFDSVPIQSELMKSIFHQIQEKDFSSTENIIIYGEPYTGRKTCALYLKKNKPGIKNFEIIEVSDTTEYSYIELLIKKSKFKIFILNSDFIFDKDLFNNQTTFEIRIPTLEDRKEDLLNLCDYFLQVYSIVQGKNRIILSDKAKEKILAYNWPGQFNELENIIENAVKNCHKTCIEPEDLFFANHSDDVKFTIGEKLENIERQYILQTLFFLQQNRTKAADVLGISIRTLRNKLNQYRKEGFL